jgi:ABC-type uncharacterized transport system permease subunit
MKDIHRFLGIYIYKAIAAVTHYRLTLNFNNTFTIDYWRDFGGKWILTANGVFKIVEQEIELLFENKNNDLANEFSILKIGEINAGLDLVLFVNNKDENYFLKQAYPKYLLCISINDDGNNFANSLTTGMKYLCVDFNKEKNIYTILNNNNKQGNYPASIFDKL